MAKANCGIATSFGIVKCHDLPPVVLRKDKRRMDMRHRSSKEVAAYRAELDVKLCEAYVAGRIGKVMSFQEWKAAR